MILGFSGYKGCGKNTAASLFRSQYGYREYAFADKIKQVVSETLGITPSQLEECKRGDITINDINTTTAVRDVIRGIGMLMRSYNEDQFVDFVSNTISKDYESGQRNFVLTDVRFRNEVEWMSNQKITKSMLVFIDRPGLVSDGHVSEDLEWIRNRSEYIIKNDGSVEDLYKSLAIIQLDIMQGTRNV